MLLRFSEQIKNYLPGIIFFCFIAYLISTPIYLHYIPKELVTTTTVVTDKYVDDGDFYLVINNHPVKVDSVEYTNTKINIPKITQERKYVGFDYYLDLSYGYVWTAIGILLGLGLLIII